MTRHGNHHRGSDITPPQPVHLPGARSVIKQSHAPSHDHSVVRHTDTNHSLLHTSFTHSLSDCHHITFSHVLLFALTASTAPQPSHLAHPPLPFAGSTSRSGKSYALVPRPHFVARLNNLRPPHLFKVQLAAVATAARAPARQRRHTRPSGP